MKRFDVIDRNKVRTSVLTVDQWQITEDAAKVLINKDYLQGHGERLLIGNLVAAGGKIYGVTTYDDFSYTCFYRGELGKNEPVGIFGASIQEEIWKKLKEDAISLAPIKKIRCPACKYPSLPNDVHVEKDIDGIRQYNCGKCSHLFWSYEAEYILQDGTDAF